MNFLNLTRKSLDKKTAALIEDKSLFTYIQHGAMTFDNPAANWRKGHELLKEMIASGFDPRAKTYIVVDRLGIAVWWTALLGRYGTIPDVVFNGVIHSLQSSVDAVWLEQMKEDLDVMR